MAEEMVAGPKGSAGGTAHARHGGKGRRPHRFHDEDRCRATIIEAAMAEFAERGYAEARMPSIQRRAGVGSWIVYHHFVDKPALHTAVLRHVHDVMRSLEVPPVGSDPVEGMAAVVRTVLQLLSDRPAYLDILTAPDPLEPRHVALLAGERVGGWPLLDHIGELVRAGAGTGAFRTDADPSRTYASILALACFPPSHLAVLAALHGTDPSGERGTDAWAEHVVAMVLASLRPHPST